MFCLCFVSVLHQFWGYLESKKPQKSTKQLWRTVLWKKIDSAKRLWKFCSQRFVAINMVFIVWRYQDQIWRLDMKMCVHGVAHTLQKWQKIEHVVGNRKHTRMFPIQTTIVEFWNTIYNFIILKISAQSVMIRELWLHITEYYFIIITIFIWNAELP